MTTNPRRETGALAAFIALFFLLQAALSFRHNLNWDEYLFLSHVYSYVDGRLADPFQTFHVHLLAWLTALPGSEADQLVAGRLFMMLCEAGSLYCLYRMAREFVSAENALFAVAAWCAAGYALVHGASFRADPLAGFLSMAALAVLMCGRRGWPQAAASGVLAAVGLLVTVKCVFFLPVFLGTFAWRWRRSESKAAVLRHFAIAGVVMLVVYAMLWALHAKSIAPPPHAAVPVAVSPLRSDTSAFHKVILSQSLFPRADYILRWAIMSALPLALFATGTWRAARRDAGAAVAVLLFAAPLLTLAIYRNAFPYYFPFILLPVALTAALGVEALRDRLLRLVVLIAMALPPLAVIPAAWREDQAAQRTVARAAHELFPSPVRYIDRGSMLPSFPKSGFFMSTWGVEGYLDAHQPVLSQAIAREQPPLLILNSPLLWDAVAPTDEPGSRRLLPSDAEALRLNYIEQWGPIWVAGKKLTAEAGRFAVAIGGTYTLECRGARQIDYAQVPCGGSTNLAPGPHGWAGGRATLRWGDHLSTLAGSPPAEPIFYGF
jgi:hypothetical protein